MELGIIGGFGGFATLDFFGRLLSEFASETERSYPHIVMAANCFVNGNIRSLPGIVVMSFSRPFRYCTQKVETYVLAKLN